jgi:hypothetical protein
MSSARTEVNTQRGRILRQARACLSRGWHVVPIPYGQKGPRVKGWPTLRLKKEDLPQAFGDTDGVGIILGAPSRGLVDVDLDAPEVSDLAAAFLQSTGRIHGRKSKPASHRWYVAEPIPATLQLADVDGSMLVELRSTGGQTVIPPSIHPGGEEFFWKKAGEPRRINGDSLRSDVLHLAGCALLSRHWPKKGLRHECSKSAAGGLLLSGWAENKVVHFLGAAARGANDEECSARINDIVSTAARIREGRPVTGIPRLAQILGANVVAKLTEWLNLGPENTVACPIVGSLSADYVQSPDRPSKDAFQGLPGAIVSAIEPHSEADPTALLTQLLICFGNAIGKGPFFKVGADRHFGNLFAVLVGDSAKARKGLSWNYIQHLYQLAAPEWASSCIQSGLSSGEGLIWAVRDPITRLDPIKQKGHVVDYESVIVDEGITDKRLLALEAEYAQPLKLASRENNILSPVLRSGWDSGNLRILTKTSPARSTGAHISVIGHITKDEVRRYLNETEQANGFANRFLWICVRRSKSLPEPRNVTDEEISDLVRELKEALSYAQGVKEVRRTEKARRLWRDTYDELSQGKAGLLGAMTSRAEAQVTRLSMIYALMDSSALVRSKHLHAALAVWDYAAASARFIFGQTIGDPLADEILQSLRRSEGGMTRTAISNLFQRHRSSAEIARALLLLARHGRALCRQERTDGRPDERWLALEPTKVKEV